MTTKITNTSETAAAITCYCRVTVRGADEVFVKMMISTVEDDERVFVRSALNGKWILCRRIEGLVEVAVNAIEEHIFPEC